MIYYLIIFYMMLAMIFFFNLFIYFLINKLILFFEIELMKISSIEMELLILLDWMSLLFISVVLIISTMVILYSMEYMDNDRDIIRFIYLIILFVLSMILMIISPNMISILFGWDGLGLISYCLVIYYQNENSYISGMVTVLINRVGDILILMLIGMMIYLGSWNFMFMEKMESGLLMMLLIVSITKSAQIPFSSWLPMAMAAPTPVSSLVHSSTLVTAGVYLLIRFNYLMIMNKKLMKFMMLLSILTLFLSGLGANFEFDLKKIIALSTLSQLGVMIFCLSLGMPEVSYFHLLTHAMFKSMLFMCAGVIIHNMLGNQDIRFISMVLYNMPLISMMFNCSSLSLCGLPFMSGFFSKDLILEMFLMSYFNNFIMIILFISMGLTVMYSIRLIYYSFIKFPQLMVFSNYYSLISKMNNSMYLLFLFSIIMGSFLSWMLFSMKISIYLSIKYKLMIYFFILMGAFIGFIIPKLFYNSMFLNFMNSYIKFFTLLWFMPMLYGFNVSKILKIGNLLIYNMELGWNEYFLGNNMIFYLNKLYKMDYIFKNFFLILLLTNYMILMIFMI